MSPNPNYLNPEEGELLLHLIKLVDSYIAFGDLTLLVRCQKMYQAVNN